MSRIVFLGLIALVLLCVLCPYCRAPAIQQDIWTRTSADLMAAGFDDSVVSVSGRDVTLTGTVPSEEVRDRIGDLAASVWGVRTVDNRLQIAAPTAGPAPAAAMPGRLELIKEGPKLILRGSVPSEDARRELVGRAESVWGEGNVVDELTVDPSLGVMPGWVGGVIDALHLRRGDLTVTLEDQSAILEGGVLSELTEERILSTAAAVMPGFDIVDRIDVREPENDYERLQADLDSRLRGKVVEFGSDSAELTANGRAVLDEVVAAMNAAPGRVQVSGHTDSQASQEHNLPLSERRAESVRDYLVSEGIDADRIVTIGFGETRSIATNQTAEGRQRNRRTEFHVLEEN